MEVKTISNDVLFSEVKKVIEEGGSVEICVKGESMNPFLVSGRDSIVLSPFAQEDLVPGAFVLGRDSFGRWVAHRVVEALPDKLILNGDGNFITARDCVARADVLALVTGYVRKGRRGSTSGLLWRVYSRLWRIAGLLGVGRNNLRRVILAVWRRFHRQCYRPES